VKVNGRIQSRKYIKIEDGEGIEKTAYEVSVISFEDV
jgi:ribosome-associated protein YbcJ (S4-like RNA binding protein)